mgnify:CR=1 FL=1
MSVGEATGIQGDCRGTAEGLQGDYTVIAEELHGDCRGIIVVIVGGLTRGLTGEQAQALRTSRYRHPDAEIRKALSRR